MKFLITLLVTISVSTSANAALIKSLFVGMDSNVANVKTDILGNDARFDHSGSSFLERPSSLSLSSLMQFDSVLYWSNYSPTTEHGNVLADYIDNGGHLVLATFVGQQFNRLANSKLATPGYLPLSGTTGAYEPRTLSSFDGASSLFDGVLSLTSTRYNADWESVTTGSSLLASWDNGDPLAAVNANGNVIAISLFPNVASFGHATGDYQQLFRNALAYDGTVSAPATIGLFALALIVLVRVRKN